MTEKNSPFLKFCRPATRRYAELYGAKSDLVGAKNFANRMIDEAARADGDLQLVSALAISALVLYVRAFSGSGMRQAPQQVLKRIVSSISEPERNLHRKFVAYRDKGFVHSENAFEANIIGLSCRTADDGSLAPKKVAAFHIQVSALSQEEARELTAVIDTVLAKFQGEIDSEQARVFALAEKLNAQELDELEPFVFSLDELWVEPARRRPQP